MLRSCRTVTFAIPSPPHRVAIDVLCSRCSTGSMRGEIRSSRANEPLSAARSTAAAVNVFVVDPI
eukprot:5518304-Prymnesium_polylepis.1